MRFFSRKIDRLGVITRLFLLAWYYANNVPDCGRGRCCPLTYRFSRFLHVQNEKCPWMGSPAGVIFLTGQSRPVSKMPLGFAGGDPGGVQMSNYVVDKNVCELLRWIDLWPAG
jgi:hypothetical protein